MCVHTLRAFKIFIRVALQCCDLWNHVKHANTQIIGIPEKKTCCHEKCHEKIFEEIIVKNFPKMEKEIATQVQETQRVLNRINPRQNTPRHILIKLAKIKHKEQLLKAAREKQQITHKGIPIRITADISIETLQARREWQDILRVMKKNNLQPRLLYPARISFRYEGELKSFTDKQKAERIQHHQTSSSTNAEGSSLERKHRKVV